MAKRKTKEIVESAVLVGGQPKKRGPGRPKGSGVKRGPGRPKGSGVKRGPGRPKGSGVKRGPGRPPKAKRGPGRPKGSGRKAGLGPRDVKRAVKAALKAYQAKLPRLIKKELKRMLR